MKILLCIISIVFLLGAVGGFITFLINKMSKNQERLEDDLWSPCWPVNSFIGGIAAVVIWCMYGPLAQIDIMSISTFTFEISLSQIICSVIIGMGGANILESQLTIYRLALKDKFKNN